MTCYQNTTSEGGNPFADSMIASKLDEEVNAFFNPPLDLPLESSPHWNSTAADTSYLGDGLISGSEEVNDRYCLF
jgi:hypothetical protein